MLTSTKSHPQATRSNALEKRVDLLAKEVKKLQTLLQESSFLLTPPVKDPKIIISEMKRTKKYSAAFLKSLKRGLEQSSIFGS